MKNFQLLIGCSLLFCIQSFAQYNFKLPSHFRVQRELPLVSMETQMDVRIRDYGAIPNDGMDDGKAINSALEMAKKLSKSGMNVRVVFEKGTYELFANGNNSHILNLEDANNILIDGNEAEIMIRDPFSGFLSIMKSKNILVQDLFIDYDPLPFTQGIVVAVDAKNKSIDVKVDEGFPLFSHQMFQKATQVWGMLKDPNVPGKLKDGAQNLFGSKDFTDLGNRVFRIKFQNAGLTRFVEVGDPYVHIARSNGVTIFKSAGSKNITYLNNTNYASPAGSYNANNMQEWNIIGGKIKLKPGRLHSANADCVHVNGGEIGPWIENCMFEGYSDDAVNMKAFKIVILKQLSPTEIVVKQSVKKGDVLRIFNPRDGVLIGDYVVANNKPNKGDGMEITLNKPLEVKLKTGENKLSDVIYQDNKCNESFVIRGNTFKNARRYGLLLQNSYGLIERNLFENLSQSGITIYNGVDWGEGFIASNIVINQNIFNNCGYDFAYQSQQENPAAIRIIVNKLKNLEAEGKWNGTTRSEWQGVNNIAITNNTFSYNIRALHIQCTTNTLIKGNRFIRNSNDLAKEHEIMTEDNNSNLVFDN
jgi:hypothetical protein